MREGCNLGSGATIRDFYPRNDLVAFVAGGKEEHESSGCRERLGGPAEVLREGSGIKVDGTAGHGLTINTYMKDAGNLPWQETSRP
jgi:hypothetical protein